MRKTLFSILSLLISYHIVAQNQKWEVHIGYQNMNAYTWDITTAYDKGYLICASVANSTTANSKILKTNMNGSLLYDINVIHTDNVLGLQKFCVDSSGNLYAGGGMWFNNAPPSLPALVKFNSCGEPVWCKYLPVTPQSVGGWVTDIIINSQNELIALIFQSTGGHADQIFIAAFDMDGKELWVRPYAKKSDYPLMVNQIGQKMIEYNNGYYIAGYCYYPYPNNPNHVFLRPLFIGIDGGFKEKWVKPFYALDTILGWANSIIPINDSVLMGVGIRKLDGGKDNSLLAFINVDGEELGYAQITNEQIGPSIKDNEINHVERINDSLFIAAANFGVETSVNPVGELVIDTDGNIYNLQSRPNTQQKPFMVKTYDDNYIILATIKQGSHSSLYLYKINSNLESVPFDTTQYVYDSLCPYPIQSGTIDLTDCPPTVSIGELPSPDEYYESIRWIPLKAYPNPVSGQELTIEFENTQHHSNMELRLYDAFGKELHRRRIYTGQQDTRLDVGHWPPGLYLAVVYSNGGAVGRCKVVVE